MLKPAKFAYDGFGRRVQKAVGDDHSIAAEDDESEHNKL